MGKKRHWLHTPHSGKPGLRPGSVVFTGEAKEINPSIIVYTYDEHSFEEVTLYHPHQLREHLDKHKEAFCWIRVIGLQQVEWIHAIGAYYNVDSLILEDIVYVGNRPKHETYPNLDFVLFKLLLHPDTYQDAESLHLETEQMSILVFDRCLVSFQESGVVSFKTIVHRIKQLGSRHRRLGPDYLAHSIIDATVDHYMLALEMIGNQIQYLESQILDDNSYDVQLNLHDIRMELIMVRKHIIPMREAIWSIYRGGSVNLREETRPFMKDVHDHMATVVETLEYTREIVANLADTYNYVINNRMNQIMKLLTIISTIFMPLTFIVGVYGMNFDVKASPWNMPELTWKWGYLAVWALMILTTLGMISYIKRRKWL
jgi:magnesium transporter